MEGVKKTVIFTRGSEIISQKKELWTKELDKEIGVIVDGGLTVFYMFGDRKHSCENSKIYQKIFQSTNISTL